MIGTGGGAAKTGGYFQLTSAGSVSKISAYIKGYGYAKAAIYSDAGGAPGSVVGGVTSQMSVPSSAGWVDFWYGSPVSLQAGSYWLTLIYDSGCNWFYSSGGVSAWNWISYGSEPASLFGSHTDRSDLISIYASLSGGSSSTPAPTPSPTPASNPVSGTFGYSSVGGSMIGTGGGAAKTGGYFQLTSAGSVSKISAYIKGYGYAKAAIYSDAGGAPGSVVGGVTSQMSVPSSAGWVDFWYGSPVSLQAGSYWLTLIYDSGCNWFYSSGGVSAWNWISYGSEPASLFGSHTDRSDLISIYASLSGGSSSTPAPTPSPTSTPSYSSSTTPVNKMAKVYGYRWTYSDATYIS